MSTPPSASARVVTGLPLVLIPLLASLAPLQEPTEPEEAAWQRLDLQANTFTSSSQEAVCLARDERGRTVVAWHSRRQQEGSYGVYAQRFDEAGGRLGGEVQVNATARSMQTRPAVDVCPDGTVWLAWESFGQDGCEGAIVARKFDATLATATAEVVVNERAAGHQEAPVLVADEEGGALVAWVSRQGAGQLGRIRARRLGADGRATGEEMELGGAEGCSDGLPALARFGEGYLAAWARIGADGRPAEILCRHLDRKGAPLGEEVAISDEDEGGAIEPALAVGGDGFAVAWMVPEGEGYRARLGRFGFDEEGGLSRGPVVSVDTGGPGYASGLAIDLDGEGRCLLSWSRFAVEREGERRRAGLFAQVFDAAGSPLGESFRASGVEEGHQRMGVATGTRRVALEDDGRAAIAWSGNAGEGDGSAAALTLLWPAGMEVAAAADDAAAQIAFEAPAEGARPHEPPVFDPDWVDPGGYVPPERATGFLGITYSGWTPPDPHLAVGPTDIVAITNGAIAFFDKDGTKTFQDEIEGSSGFWGAQGAGGFVFDPEVLYDPHTDRFMAMACERNGPPFFLFAVSDDSDPNGSWHKYRFNVQSAAGDTDIDSPNMAVDSQAVYLTADFFGPDKYLIWIIDKSSVLNGGTASTTNALITGDQSFGIPVTYGTPPAQYMIESKENSSNTQFVLWAITNPLGTPQLQSTNLTVPTYQYPEDPPQQGTSTRPELFEPRFWSCVYRNGSLWATHHQGGSRVVQRWYQIDMANWPTSGTPSLVQWGDVDGGGDIRTFFGSIWVDEDDNAALTVARSSPNEYISMAVTTRRSSDPAGHTEPMTIVQNSTGADTTGRWGDYSGTAAEPAIPGSFWGIHEYRAGTWKTWIENFHPLSPDPLVYCTAKVNSAGLTPQIGWLGEPSLSAANFEITCTNGLAGKPGQLFHGGTPAVIPFKGGILCAQPPLTRAPVFQFDPFGFAQVPVTFLPGDVGTVQYWQTWYRDPQHLDGTGVGLSDALEVWVGP